MTVEYSTLVRLAPFPPTMRKDKILCLWDRGDGLRCSDVLRGDALPLHLNSVHGCRGQDDTILTCWWDGCGHRTKKYAIVSHIQDVHLGVTYPCRRCGITFGGKSSFEMHLPGCPVIKK